MTVVFDLLGFQNRDHGERGIARYVLHLALALERVAPGLVDQYLMHPGLPFPTGAESLVSTGRVVRSDRLVERRLPTSGGVLIAGTLFEELTEPTDYVFPLWARSPQWRTAAVLYDLIPARYPEWYLNEAPARAAYRGRTSTLASFDHLLSISEASADDAVELLGVDRRRITVIGAGADERFHRPAIGPEEVTAGLIARDAVPGLRPGFLLFPTGIDHRKNVDRTIEAYGLLDPALRRRHQLVLVCRMDDYGRALVEGLARSNGVTEDLLATGFVSDEVLGQLYQGAHGVIFPSLYEGFGLPVLEAMQCGAPVICSDSSSLKEVQTRADARFDPTSAPAIAAAMERLLNDEVFRDELRNQPLPGFTWDEAARRTAAVVTDLQRQVARRVAGGGERRRLALFSPLPPQRSGIATYTNRLLEELRHLCEVTVFVDVDPSEVTAPEGVAVEPIRSFGHVIRGGGAFDRVLYFLGNSTFHMEMLGNLRNHPGWVLLHDVRLSGLYNSIEQYAPHHSVTGSVGGLLQTLYPFRYQRKLEEQGLLDPDTANRFGIFLTREVAQLADRVLVHSDFAASMVELDAGVEPTVVFPIPCPPVEAEGPDGRRVAPEGRPIVSSFGIVAPVKSPEKLIRALPAVVGAVPDVLLRFVGAISDEYRRQLRDLADSHGVADAVELCGHLDDDEFAAAQRDTTIAVQLRSFTNGESSAAVADLLARGVPTVVSDLGAMAELPVGVVDRVGADCTPGELADAMIRLLGDAGARRRLSTGAVSYASANGFERAAEVLYKTLFP